MDEFDQKIALITGGARGLGAATATLLAERGARVVITDVLDADGEAKASEIGAEYLHHDVASEADWESVRAQVFDQFGRVDILMNNAAIFHSEPIAGHATETWQRVISINQNSVFFGLRDIGGRMLGQGSGSIINVASVAVKNNTETSLAYTASKAAIIGMTKVAAREFGPHGVRVNALVPGAIDTEMVDAFDPDRKHRDRTAKGVPLRRTSAPEEIAHAALFLASDQSGFCTGETLQIDGGAAC